MSPLSPPKNPQAIQDRTIYKLAEFGKLSSGLFHDMMHPITSLLLEIDNLRNTKGKDDHFKSLIESRKCLQQYIQNMRKLLSSESQISHFNINSEINSSIQILHYKLRSKDIQIKTLIPATLSYTGNPFTFYQVITNLISNAIDSYHSITTPKKKIIIVGKNEKNTIKISIQDYSCGIKSSQLKQIFKPFVSTKNGPNLGLGLSISKDIIEKEYKGTLNVQSTLNKGSTFTIVLPRKN